MTPETSAPKKRRPARLRARRRLLTIRQILAWADAWFARTGHWPHVASGPIPEALGETWASIESNLRRGQRGLPYRTTLARLLAEHRGARNHMGLAPLTIAKILLWADAYYRATGTWPTAESGAIAGAPGETWLRVETALRNGLRGLPGGTSLARLLAQTRGVRNPKDLPRLTRRRILAWADAYRALTGAWPTRNSGPVAEAPGETWSGLDTALRDGLRGLKGGSSLARLLARHRGVPNPQALARLTIAVILAWADAHRALTGQWPTMASGPVRGVDGETWHALDSALRQGLRGLPGGSSLARLLARHRGVRNSHGLPPLSKENIVAWARAYRRRTGELPTKRSGRVAECPETTWLAVDTALHKGGRGLTGGTTLRRFLRRVADLTPSSAGGRR
jgi:hypothetical protein